MPKVCHHSKLIRSPPQSRTKLVFRQCMFSGKKTGNQILIPENFLFQNKKKRKRTWHYQVEEPYILDLKTSIEDVLPRLFCYSLTALQTKFANNKARGLARKATVFRCRHRHALRGVGWHIMGVACQWGCHIPGEGFNFGPYLADDWHGGGIHGGGGNQRSCQV